jgi:hypothetical protein
VESTSYFYSALGSNTLIVPSNLEKLSDITLRIYVDIFIMIMTTKMYYLTNKDHSSFDLTSKILYKATDIISSSYIKTSVKVDKTLVA